MYTRYYDSYPVAPPADTSPADDVPSDASTCNNGEEEVAPTLASCKSPGIFGNIKTEDILLIALLFITASDSDDNLLMPFILVALLLG